MNLLLPFAFLLLFGLIWIVIGLINYVGFIKKIEQFKELYRSMEKREKENKDMSIRTQLFLKRMKLEKEFPKQFAFMLEFETRHDAFIKESARALLLVGPIYWLSKEK